MARRSVNGTDSDPRGAGGALAAVLLATAAILVYVNAMPNEFVFDDKHLILGNPVLQDMRNLPKILTGHLWESVPGRTSNYYRPIPTLTFMTAYNLAGPHAWAFRLFNILLHAGTSVLVFLTAARLLAERGESRARAVGSGAFLAALLFAVHPIHVEGVAWVSGVMDVGVAFFGLLAFFLYIGADRTRPGGVRYQGAVIAFFAATLVKEPGLLVLPIIAVFDLTWPGVPRRTFVGHIRRWAPFAAAAGAYLLLRMQALRGFAPFELAEPLDPVAAVLTAPFLYAVYLAKLVVPVRLSALPDIAPVASLGDPRAWIGAAAVVATLAAAWWAYRRDRLVLSGLALTVLPLLPAFYLPALGRELRHAFADRYAYFPSVGLALIVAAGLAVLLHRRAARRPVFVFVALLARAYAAGTVSRNRVWRDELALWTDAEAKAHDSAEIFRNLGFALLYERRPAEGAEMLRRAHLLRPELDDELIAGGIRYAREGSLMDAMLTFQSVLTFEPNSAVAHYNLGWVYEMLGRPDAAIVEYRRALAIYPDYADAHSNLGVALAKNGNLVQALEHFEQAAAAAPDNPSHHENLRRAREMLARPD